jgi:hypothetical protein
MEPQRWYYTEDQSGPWMPFPLDINYDLETSYLIGKKQKVVLLRSSYCKVNLTTGQMVHEGKTYTVKRLEDQEENLLVFRKYLYKENYILSSYDDTEFNNLKDTFKTSIGSDLFKFRVTLPSHIKYSKLKNLQKLKTILKEELTLHGNHLKYPKQYEYYKEMINTINENNIASVILRITILEGYMMEDMGKPYKQYATRPPYLRYFYVLLAASLKQMGQKVRI